MKEIEEIFRKRIYYIGEEIPNGVANDKRQKFVLLGTPQEVINELEALFKEVKNGKI